ncbi:hypothetical protein [Aliiglaciecola litoralis]|uniref:ADP-heptose:LPS heptosyltransferase n=1 Tax=Aliiglaciecola litoralis TaxID=582857 RepID=A0ABN1LL54_9ALTE
MSKILVIRMLELGDVASIGIPALRHIKANNPESEVYCLTHGQGKELISLAEPEVKLIGLPQDLWPDHILKALEAFLGLAEQIIEIGFDQIINLDTAFMPNFLARFLKDAGEPVVGNYLSVPLQTLIDQIQNQSLQPEYVNNAQQYMLSTFFSMYKWHSQWWTGNVLPDNGYPEFYLVNCCGFSGLEYNNQLLDKKRNVAAVQKTAVYIALSDQNMPYLHQDELQKELESRGFSVFIDNETQAISQRLETLAQCDICVCFANAVFALANGVSTPTLLIPMQLDPRILMPDYSADESLEHPLPNDLADSIASIFEQH